MKNQTPAPSVAQHSSGPWRILALSEIISARGSLVARVMAKSKEVGEPDARLIAAAPELLAALRDIAEGCANRSAMQPTVELHRFMERIRDHARAAIAQAEGRT